MHLLLLAGREVTNADVYVPKPRLLALGGGVTSRRSAAISRNHNHMHTVQLAVSSEP